MSTFLEKILDKYRFKQPVSEADKKAIPKIKHRVLKKILKKQVGTSPVKNIAIQLYLSLQQIGIQIKLQTSINIARGGMVLAILTVVATATIIIQTVTVSPIQQLAYITNIKGTVTLNKNTTLTANNGLLKTIKTGTRITTATDSEVTVQIPGKGTTRLLANSKAILNLAGAAGKTTSIFLETGQVYSYVIPGNKYMIDTKDFSVTVKGTRFLTSALKTGFVKVTEGAVAIKTVAAKKITLLKKGHKAIISLNKPVEVTTLSVIEKLQLKKLGQLPYIKDIKTKAIPEIKLLIEKTLVLETKIEETIKDKLQQLRKFKKLDPLDKLRKQGKTIAMIHLKNGTRFAGSISKKDNSFLYLDTGEGIIQIPLNRIKKRTYVR